MCGGWERRTESQNIDSEAEKNTISDLYAYCYYVDIVPYRIGPKQCVDTLRGNRSSGPWILSCKGIIAIRTRFDGAGFQGFKGLTSTIPYVVRVRNRSYGWFDTPPGCQVIVPAAL